MGTKAKYIFHTTGAFRHFRAEGQGWATRRVARQVPWNLSKTFPKYLKVDVSLAIDRTNSYMGEYGLEDNGKLISELWSGLSLNVMSYQDILLFWALFLY